MDVPVKAKHDMAATAGWCSQPTLASFLCKKIEKSISIKQRFERQQRIRKNIELQKKQMLNYVCGVSAYFYHDIRQTIKLYGK